MTNTSGGCQFIVLLMMDAKGVRNMQSILVVVNKHKTARVASCWFIIHCSKSDPCSYELFCLESHILSFPTVLQIPPESPCILQTCNARKIKYIKKKMNLLYVQDEEETETCTDQSNKVANVQKHGHFMYKMKKKLRHVRIRVTRWPMYRNMETLCTR